MGKKHAKIAGAALFVSLMAGCGDGKSAEQREISDREAIAAVKAAQERKPPVQPAAVQPLTVADLDRHNLHNTGCTLTNTSIGAGPLIVASDGRAMIRIDGEIEPLAADVGGEQLGSFAWRHYVGKRFALTLQPDSDAMAQGRALQTTGTIEVRDAYGRQVFTSQGQIACAA